MLYKLYLVKNPIIANSSATPETREKMVTDLKSLEFWGKIDAPLTKFKKSHFT